MAATEMHEPTGQSLSATHVPALVAEPGPPQAVVHPLVKRPWLLGHDLQRQGITLGELLHRDSLGNHLVRRGSIPEFSRTVPAGDTPMLVPVEPIARLKVFIGQAAGIASDQDSVVRQVPTRHTVNPTRNRLACIPERTPVSDACICPLIRGLALGERRVSGWAVVKCRRNRCGYTDQRRK